MSRRVAFCVWLAWLSLPVQVAFGQCEIPQKVTANDTRGFDPQFGNTVSISADTVVVGAEGDDCMDGGNDCGSAYVFRLDGTTWIREAKLVASDAVERDLFGNVFVNGDVAVVGARGVDCSAGNDCGAAYVYRRDGTTWFQEAKVTAPDAAAGDFFGTAASLSGDVLVIGARNDDWAAGADAGSAHIFRSNGTSWSWERWLIAPDGTADDLFGSSVSVSGDVVVVGAPGDDCAAGANCGSAYVFRFDGSGWNQEVKLTTPDASGGGRFGISTSISGDTIVVGALLGRGVVYVFRHNGTNWILEDQLAAPEAPAGDWDFGRHVSVDGDTLLVGAPYEPCPSGHESFCGGAYVYGRFRTTWATISRILDLNPAQGEEFGGSVSVNGNRAVVGNFRDNSSKGSALILPVGPDCNGNGIDDASDICEGRSPDTNENGIPDECERVIPTVSEWGMLTLALLLLIVGTILLRRKAHVG